MLFDSYLFIFMFLPVCALLYAVLTHYRKYNYALAWLVGASLFFYGWWNPPYLILLLLSIAVNFMLGSVLRQRAKLGLKSDLILICGVTLNLLFIGYFKYAYFFIANLNQFVTEPIPFDPIILPLGISFFTFQKIAFLVDASRGEIKDLRFLDYCLFVTFFPQLIAGPIVQHKQIIPQVQAHTRLKISSKNLSIGLTLFFIGLFKKIAIADSIAVYANAAFNGAATGMILSFWEAWAGAFAYALQLYFDFSGYSDMAIGLGYLFGIKLPINFNSPYKATNIIDFWHRWHMTLSAFLKDYLYIPLGGNRNGNVRRYLNLMLTMLLGGLWHGANWTFVCWGAMHGLFLMINHLWRFTTKSLKWLSLFNHQIMKYVSQGLTLLAVVVAWVPFRADNIKIAKDMLVSMFSLSEITLPNSILSSASHFQGKGMFYNGLANWYYGIPLIMILMLMVVSVPNSMQLMRYELLGAQFSHYRFRWYPTKQWALVMAMLVLTTLMLLSEESEFLYFQF